MSEKLEFENNGLYVYFIRPKPSKNFDNMPIYLSVASNEEEAWEHVFGKDSKEQRIQTIKEYYIDDIFLSNVGQAHGLLWFKN